MSEEPVYVCGHGPRELRRLEIQADFYGEITRIFLQRAGLVAGMRVLDLGCGAGDVSFLAAELVGATGMVIGIDRSSEAIAWARERTHVLGLSNVEFRVTHINSLQEWDVDAVIGRFVLMHQPDPAQTLRHAMRYVRRGGVLAFLESHLAACVAGMHSYPYSPVYDRAIAFMKQCLQSAGAAIDMGMRLRATFVSAGLPEPELWLQARMEGGADAAIHTFTAESLRSMQVQAVALGIAFPVQAEIDELETELRAESRATGGVLTAPPVVGAWCTVPARTSGE